MLRRLCFFVVGSLLLPLLVGCGGGSGGVEPPNPPANVTQVTVEPGVEAQADLGDWSMTVPVGTFPDGANITIEKSSPVELPHDFSPVALDAGVSITADHTPEGPIYIDVGAGRASNDVLFYLQWVGGKWQILAGGARNTARLILDKSKFVAGNISGVLGSVIWTPPSSEVKIVELARMASPTWNSRTVLLVHGFNGNVHQLQALADRLCSAGRYEVVFGLQYDYRQDLAVTARGLYEQMNALHATWGYTDIVAHSAGVIVSRYMIERIGRPEGLNYFYGVCGPNRGSLWANVGEFLRTVQVDWFNTTYGTGDLDSGVGIPVIDSPSIPQLANDSAFLQSLNNYYPAERTNVIYHLIGAELDEIVGESSGRGEGIDFSRKTTGGVLRLSEFADHNGLVRDSAGIDLLIHDIQGLQGFCDLWDPSIGIARNAGEEWQYTLTIRNYSSGTHASTAVIVDIAMEEYDYYGAWKSTKWYNMATGQFETGQKAMNLTLQSGQSYSISRVVPVDLSLPATERPCVKLYMLRYNQTGVGTWTWVWDMYHVYNGQFPYPPVLRSSSRK